MHALRFTAAMLLCAAPLFSDTPGQSLATETASAPSAPKPAVSESVLPLKIPGYELRTLDVRKPVVFNVNGTSVEASLPIFFYYPVAGRAPAAPLLRQAYGDLLKLGQKPEWTGAELQRVLANFDAAIRLLEQPPEASLPAASPVNAGP